MPGRVLIDRKDGVAHVRLDRPEKRNALDEGLFTGLLEAAREFEEDASLRAVVISGEGQSFCAGIDLSNFGQMADGSMNPETLKDTAKDLSRDGANRAQQVRWAWQELSVPVIAAVEGAAYGAGCQLALCADIRIVAPDARLALVEVTWGLVPDMGGTQALRRIVPLDVAKRIAFTGDPISGREALALHLATEVNDRPVEAALELAAKIAQRSPDAVRAIKRVLNASALVAPAVGFANEFDESMALMGKKNQVEAVMSKLAKRDPKFEDPI